ncbi:MAG: MBL fold metallo-hydrolase [Candidatus Dormibacteria bacterium]
MEQVAADVWHIPGTPSNWINVYLIGDVLVDASRRGVGPAIVRELGERQLSMVALTHVHPDHQGAAKFLCEHYGVPLACHPADRDRMEGTVSSSPGTLAATISETLFSGPPHKVGRLLQEGDEVAGFRVHHTPGHTMGEVIFFRETDRVAIVGDVLNGMNLLTTRTGIHEPPAGFSRDPAENRRSIRKLAELEPRILCFGHGPVSRDPAQLKKFVTRLRTD